MKRATSFVVGFLAAIPSWLIARYFFDYDTQFWQYEASFMAAFAVFFGVPLRIIKSRNRRDS